MNGREAHLRPRTEASFPDVDGRLLLYLSYFPPWATRGDMIELDSDGIHGASFCVPMSSFFTSSAFSLLAFPSGETDGSLQHLIQIFIGYTNTI